MNDTYFVDGVEDQVRALTGLRADLHQRLYDLERPGLRPIFPIGRRRCYLASPDRWTIDGVAYQVLRLRIVRSA